MYGSAMYSVEMFAGNPLLGAPPVPPTPPPPTPPVTSQGNSGPSRGRIVRVSPTNDYPQGEAAHFQRQLVRRPWNR